MQKSESVWRLPEVTAFRILAALVLALAALVFFLVALLLSLWPAYVASAGLAISCWAAVRSRRPAVIVAILIVAVVAGAAALLILALVGQAPFAR